MKRIIKNCATLAGLGLLATLPFQATAEEGAHGRAYYGFTNDTGQTLYIKLSENGVIYDEMWLQPGQGFQSRNRIETFIVNPPLTDRDKYLKYDSFVKKGKREYHNLELSILTTGGKVLGTYFERVRLERPGNGINDDTDKHALCKINTTNIDSFLNEFLDWNVSSQDRTDDGYDSGYYCVRYFHFY
ncbi:hypothetical protein HCH_03510 [Hahella chejuensis KCTC 2396]|uniref:Secreted protein n=1 Tax=Hahella chejuensis (strain KCTC 2396) TaxID=349521 RepID=Q2SGG8_HAHCH|nr:hypothetical protein [Hahella chejuensis]ABC30256.1 hypothetical protein HCH_03510 [Hahella chejuensis KCTC 2396]